MKKKCKALIKRKFYLITMVYVRKRRVTPEHWHTTAKLLTLERRPKLEREIRKLFLELKNIRKNTKKYEKK